jgi:type I restriction enzyme S subunit
MKAAQVLDQFDRISDAPDAIPRLRRFILDLAIRGKLVEQSPEDEPTSELLKRIQLKSRTGVIKQKRDPNENRAITEDEIPFSVSSNITFARLATIARIEKGSTGIQKAKPGNYPLVTLAEDRATSAEYQFDAAATIVPLISSTGHGHASLKRMHYQEGKFALGNILCAVIPFAPELVSARFLYEYLWAYKEALLVERMIGTANVSLTIGKIGEAPVPIISPRSQERLRELMVLCDRLETAQTEHESRRDKLAAASLHRLNNSANADKFREHTRFHLRHLLRLTTRPEHLQQLRQTIRNLAVRGKLVPQYPEEEPVAELLKRIEEKKTRLMKEGVIPKQKPSSMDLAVAWDREVTGWTSVRFGAVCNNITSGSRGWAEFYSTTGAKFIRAQNIRFGKLYSHDLASVNPPKKAEGLRTRVSKGDLLVVITGAGVTNPALVDIELGEAYVSQHIALIKPTDTSLSPWLLLCLMAPSAARSELIVRAYGAGKPGLNLDNIRSLVIPVPPMSEQNRILAKVNQLMALCDRLDGQLTTTQTESRLLLEAVLHEALSRVA